MLLWRNQLLHSLPNTDGINNNFVSWLHRLINRSYYSRLYRNVSLTIPSGAGQQIQTFTVAGIRTSDTVYVSRVDAGTVSIVNARVSAQDTLELTFLDPDGSTGTYNIFVIQVD